MCFLCFLKEVRVSQKAEGLTWQLVSYEDPRVIGFVGKIIFLGSSKVFLVEHWTALGHFVRF